MKKCKHRSIQVRYIDDRFWHYVSRKALTNGDVVAVRCAKCYTPLPLGTSNDAPEAVHVEMRAAESIAVGAYICESNVWRNDDTGTFTITSDDPGFDRYNATLWPWDPTRPIAEQDEPWMRPNEQDMRTACERAGLIAERCDGCDDRCPVGTCERMREAIEDHDNAPCEACDTADGCEEHQMFTCSGCGKLVPWADGADDDGPDVCSACWCAANGVTASSDRDDLVEVDLIVGEEPEHGVEAEVSVGPTNEPASTESPGDAFMRRTASMVQLTADDMRTRIGRKP